MEPRLALNSLCSPRWTGNSYVAQAGIELKSSCLGLLSAGITDMHHYA
jgi:hypothetical protein